MTRLAGRIKDKRVLKVIRQYLRSGVMISGVTVPTEEGTPQGGPLSPLKSAEPPWYVIRMPGGVGGLLSDGESYPDSIFLCPRE